MIKWVGITVLSIAVVYIALPAAIKIVLRRRFLARVRRSGRICLTFDDGPNPETTPRILEMLARAGVRATFFMIGERARRHPELVSLVARGGHELGEHGFAHRHAWHTGPLGSLLDLVRGHRALVDASAGAAPVSLRPPYGKLNLVTLLYAGLHHRPLAFWDVDPRDYQSTSIAVARHVSRHLERGRVILLHDGRVRPGSDPLVTVEALEMILAQTAGRDLPFTTVGEALGLDLKAGGP